MSLLTPIILSLYLSAILYRNAFFVKQLVVLDKGNQLFFNELGIFIIFFVPVFFLMKRIVLPSQTRGARGALRYVLLLLVLLGLVISFLYHVIPIGGIYDLPQSIDRFFASDEAFTLWLITPLLALFI